MKMEGQPCPANLPVQFSQGFQFRMSGHLGDGDDQIDEVLPEGSTKLGPVIVVSLLDLVAKLPLQVCPNNDLHFRQSIGILHVEGLFSDKCNAPYKILEGMNRVDSADTISDLPDMMLISPHYHDGSRAAAGHESKTGQSEMRCHKRRRRRDWIVNS